MEDSLKGKIFTLADLVGKTVTIRSSYDPVGDGGITAIWAFEKETGNIYYLDFIQHGNK